MPSPNRLVVATWASLSKRLRQTKLAWPSPREDFTSFVIMATKAFQRLYIEESRQPFWKMVANEEAAKEKQTIGLNYKRSRSKRNPGAPKM